MWRSGAPITVRVSLTVYPLGATVLRKYRTGAACRRPDVKCCQCREEDPPSGPSFGFRNSTSPLTMALRRALGTLHVGPPASRAGSDLAENSSAKRVDGQRDPHGDWRA